jgi:hypothetical protein
VKPVLQALVLAERVYRDVSGKKIIAGTFNEIHFSRESPGKEVARPDGTTQKLVLDGMQGGSPCAYISLTDVCKDTKLLLQFVNLTKNQVLIGTEIKVVSDTRLGTVEVVLPLPSLPIAEEGTYAFEVVCEGEILGSHRISAKEIVTSQ